MKYSDFIKVNNSFQYSINLQYDLNNLDKIDSYIPTNMSIELLSYYLKNIYNEKGNKNRSTVLIGPYGKGKSHLLLILIAIISVYSNNEDKNQILNNLLDKIKKLNEETYSLIKEVRKNNKKFLPVIINSNYTDLNQSFLIALKEALERENLGEIIPETYFNSVTNIIKNWGKNYKETYKKFEDVLKYQGISIKEFLYKIKNYDKEMYELFKKAYEKITSGGIFNPLISVDVPKLYEEVNFKICNEKQYKGIFIVFDEFSKFLEGSTSRNSALDMNLLQDFAELANRSEKNQIHLCCITHKPINDYLSKLSKEKIDGWRAVEGRFKEIYFTSSSSQNYELIANTLIKDKNSINKYLSDNKSKFLELINSCGRLGLYQDVENYYEVIGKGCYPLNPISTYVLPRISEKVAQNERTLFTFLAKDEKGSLVRFINEKKSKFSFLNIDYIYDYFKVLFEKDIFNESIYRIWIKTEGALKKVKEKNEKKIIKSISLIYIVNELNRLTPTDSVIQASLDMDRDEYLKAIDSLISNQILLKQKSNNFYRFLPGSNLNVLKAINNVKETKIRNINYKEILQEIIELGYELPKRHNDKYEMTRFFKNEFITLEELESFKEEKEIFNLYKSDGIIFYLIYEEDDEKYKALHKMKELNSRRTLICISNKKFDKIKDLKEYRAIQYLKNDEEFIKSDNYILQELKVYENNIVEYIAQYIKENYYIQNGNCNYFYLGKRIDKVKKASQISKFISDICDNCFKYTPFINNEMINKMKISPQILKARNKIIEYIFRYMDDKNFKEIDGNGPEATIYRATIKNKGLSNGQRLSNNDKNLNIVIGKIETFVFNCEGNKQCFFDLYEILYGESFGLRAGIIPIYISFVLKDFKRDVVIYYVDNGKEKEVPLSVDTINNINNEPNKYYLYIEKGTKEKRKYIDNLSQLFCENRESNKVGYSMFNYIVESMQKWIQSLPKYSREFEVVFYENDSMSIENIMKELRESLLKIDINPREFLFDKIKEIIKENNYDVIYKKIFEFKRTLDNHIYEFKNSLIIRTKNIFDKDYTGQVTTLLYEWYNDLPKSSKEHLYDSYANDFLNFIGKANTYDDIYVIEKIANIITGLNIEDWNDTIISIYESKLKEIKDEVENYNKKVYIGDEFYEIRFFSNEYKKNKIFKSENISSIGKALFNEIEEIFDEYGDSVEDNEKRNVLIKLIKKLM